MGGGANPSRGSPPTGVPTGLGRARGTKAVCAVKLEQQQGLLRDHHETMRLMRLMREINGYPFTTFGFSRLSWENSILDIRVCITWLLLT